MGIVTPEDLEACKDKNIFIMMRYGQGDVYARIETAIKQTLKRYKFNGILARDVMFRERLWDDIQLCMECSRYGIVIFEENVEHPEFNPNVSVELGFMMAQKKNVLILREHNVRPMPSDLLGRRYVKFNRGETLERDIEDAIAKWLLGLGHIPLAETISAANPMDAKMQRTARVIEALGAVPVNSIIRQAGSLSSLAISKEETLLLEGDADGTLKKLLLDERDAMISALENGAILRCIICPDVQKVAADLNLIPPERIISDVLPRFKQLIKILEKDYFSKPSLQVVYVANLPHNNMLIARDEMFIGRRRLHEWGFPSTTVIRDPELLRSEINQFDELFGDAARAILGTKICGEGDYGAEMLKRKVVDHLKECMADLAKKGKTKETSTKSSYTKARTARAGN